MRRLCNALSGINADERRSGNDEVQRKLDAFEKLQRQCNSIHLKPLHEAV